MKLQTFEEVHFEGILLYRMIKDKNILNYRGVAFRSPTQAFGTLSICLLVTAWLTNSIRGTKQYVYSWKNVHPNKNFLNFKKDDADAIIEHISIGFIQNMIGFIIKLHKIWLSSPRDN